VITLPRTVRVWAYGRPVDLRKGYNGLVGIVENELRSDPMGGELYLFVNAKRTGCKVLLWDATIATLHIPEAIANERRSRYRSIRSVASLLR
jgi:transposase